MCDLEKSKKQNPFEVGFLKVTLCFLKSDSQDHPEF